MRLYFDHILGKQKNKDFVFSLVSATFEEEEWDWAFENGWAPATKWFDSNFAFNNPLVWYQCRQSRIVLDDYSPNPKTKKLVNKTPVSYIIDTCRQTNKHKRKCRFSMIRKSSPENKHLQAVKKILAFVANNPVFKYILM